MDLRPLFKHVFLLVAPNENVDVERASGILKLDLRLGDAVAYLISGVPYIDQVGRRVAVSVRRANGELTRLSLGAVGRVSRIDKVSRGRATVRRGLSRR